MNYMLCNFLGNNLHKPRKSGFSEVLVDIDNTISEAELYKSGDVLRFVEKGVACDGELVDLLGNFSCDKAGSTEEELKHTDENPIIVIATKGIRVYDNIPTYIKYMTVNEGVFVILLKGIISVVSDNGEEIPLSRNCDAVAKGEGHLYSYEDINKWNSLVDKESGLCFSDYVVSDCIINRSRGKDNSVSVSIKFTKDNFVVLNKEAFIKGALRKKEEAKRKKEEAERKAQVIKMLSEQRSVKDKDAKKSKVKKSKNVSSEDDSNKVGSAGAKSFLNYVASLKK